MKMTTCSMSVNLEQTDVPGEVPPPPHPGRSTAASSVAAVAAPIFNNSRRVTFLEGMGSSIHSFRGVGSATLTHKPSNSPCQAGPVIESSPSQERRPPELSLIVPVIDAV